MISTAADIVYTDADEIYGYHFLLSKIFESARGFDYSPVNNAEEVYAYSQLLGRLMEWYGGVNNPRGKTPMVRALVADAA